MHTDGTATFLHDTLGYREAEPDAFTINLSRALELAKAREQLVKLVRRDAQAAVENVDEETALVGKVGRAN